VYQRIHSKEKERHENGKKERRSHTHSVHGSGTILSSRRRLGTSCRVGIGVGRARNRARRACSSARARARSRQSARLSRHTRRQARDLRDGNRLCRTRSVDSGASKCAAERGGRGVGRTLTRGVLVIASTGFKDVVACAGWGVESAALGVVDVFAHPGSVSSARIASFETELVGSHETAQSLI